MYKIYNYKLLRIMRLTIVMLIAAMMQVSAASFAQRVTLNEKRASVEKILKKIRAQTNYDFLFEDDLLKAVGEVAIKVSNVPLEEALQTLFSQTSLTYNIEGKIIVILAKKKPLPQNKVALFGEIDVKGKVVDEAGHPLVGATISILVQESSEDEKTGDFSMSIKGRKAITVTNAAGEFELKNVAEQAYVIISYIGYQDYSIKAAKDLGIIKMKLSGKLQEVVVTTGYQQISKERSAASFAKPDMNVVADRATSNNIIQRLDGLVPGLVINNSPTSGKQQYLIRGLSTLSNVQNYASATPLFVVDGIPIADISSINPQDVQDISVLKDATASSIWGARASNGVIVITTKKGSKNQQLRISYNAFTNFQGRPNISYFPMMNSAQYLQASKETFDPINYTYSPIYTPVSGNTGYSPDRKIEWDFAKGLISAAVRDAKLDSLAGIDNLSQMKDIFYRPQVLMNHTLSLSGGTERYVNYTSISYHNNQSYIPGNSDNTYKINTRHDYTFNPNIKAYFIADLTNQRTASSRAVTPDNRFLPYQLFQDASGNSIDMSYLGYTPIEAIAALETLTGRSLRYNPIDNQRTGMSDSKAFTARLTSGLTINLYKGLRYEGVFGYLRGANRSTSYDDNTNYNQNIQILQFAQNNGGTIKYNLPNINGKYGTTNYTDENWTIRNQLVYDYTSKNRLHELSILAGYEAQEQKNIATSSSVFGYNVTAQTSTLIDYNTLTATGIAGGIIPTLGGNARLSETPFTQSEALQRFKSFYGNVGYTFDKRYTLNASWRQDKSNLFGINKSAQRKPAWSVGGKWTLSNEPFLKGNATVNTLATRITYGIGGNSPTPGKSANQDVLVASTNVNVPGGQAYSVQTPGNKNLTWEQTRTLNVGLDFSLFHSRLSGSLDFYQKKSSDLIGPLSVNPFTGFPTIVGNVGNISNSGMEASIQSVNINSHDFKWNSSFTLSYNKNKVTKINLLTAVVTGRDQINAQYLQNYPAFSVFAFNYAGLDASGNPLVRLANGSASLGMTNATTPLANDALFKGVFQPSWNGGLSNTFGYKHISLNINIIYNLGNVMFRDVNTIYTEGLRAPGFIGNQNFQSGNLRTDFANRWQKPGDEFITDIPSYRNLTDHAKRNTDYYRYGHTNIVSAAYMKIRDLSIAYTFSKTLLSKLKIEGLSLRAGMSNIMLWKANDYGIDPEFQDARFGNRTLPTAQNAFNLGIRLTL
ncbi:SusC/RagA family TonB-linked outer membrane protein [Pedobacter chitinilyticus]|uniref:SusC/RagA family TonB-linked outer membrane protein n=1 Tax=Pedobacter chitinilyticus TaxID=2233776 RepID=A0A3S4RTM9_9SPHI|nr:SusC/RagA family TonB-linked outer membrane protein [Pedobacter chitinilyticus]RWU10633.1 SusC/RagA family TonB-linked outer membrane protein [Pedobacter chitinilyticus]